MVSQGNTETETKSGLSQHVALLILTLAATVQFFDRALMVVILEPLKQEFSLSDAQLGLLSGLSYAAAFALAGIPFGWLADRGHRRNLLAGLLDCWPAGACWWLWPDQPEVSPR